MVCASRNFPGHVLSCQIKPEKKVPTMTPCRRLSRKTSLEDVVEATPEFSFDPDMAGRDGLQWVDAVCTKFGKQLAANLVAQGRPLSYGSDCSGIDAPFWGLRELLQKLGAHGCKAAGTACMGDSNCIGVKLTQTPDWFSLYMQCSWQCRCLWSTNLPRKRQGDLVCIKRRCYNSICSRK